MNHSNFHHHFQRAQGSRQGAALVLVLGILVLVSALAISFLSSVRTELVSSQSYANGVSARQLADSAVQIVSSQISDATKGTTGDALDATAPRLAWASQPGMIRTYDTSGNPGKFYKLYSSSTLIIDGSSFAVASEIPPTDWNATAKKGLYTDLNSPVTSNSLLRFPIIDPRAKSTSTTSSVEGFDYKSTVNGVVLPAAGTDSQRLPMPVRWLYVLQDGTLAIPASGSNGTITFDSSNPPSAKNPIVGRIAFWTDDETCKVNINTASEGTFWDRPWAHTASEEKYSSSIPAQNEFQRYPGHPSKTSLSTVFGQLLPAPAPSWYFNIPAGTLTQNQSKLAAYYTLSPRIGTGGTQGGTVDNTSTSFTAISTKSERLYTSVDEFFYSPLSASGTRQTNASLAAVNAAIDNTFLEKAKFFLTAHSRAPELNLFGKPRLSLWPLQLSAAQRNAKDQLLAFCSTINNSIYYFQRYNAYSAFGTACSSQDPLQDWTGVTRNQQLYTYLDTLTQQDIPGFGGRFSGKYPNTRTQILTEMLDMIRSGVNAYSNALTPTYNYAPQLGDSGEGQIVPLAPNSGSADGTRGFGRFATITEAAIIFYRANAAYAVTNSNGTVAVPVQLTPASAAPQIAALVVLQPYTVSPGLPSWSPNVHYIITGLDNFKIKSPSLAAYTALGFSANPDNWAMGRMCYSGSQNSTAGNSTAFLSFKGFFRCATAQNTGFNGNDYTKPLGRSSSKLQYPFYSNTGSTFPITGVALGSTDTTFDFSGGSVAVQIYSDSNGSPGQLLQTVKMKFPEVLNLPVPTTAATTPAASNKAYDYSNRFLGTAGSTPSGVGTQGYSRDLRNLLIECQDVYIGTDTNDNPVSSRTMDVVRSMRPDPNGPAKGDLRLYAALATVPESYFTTSPNYDSGTNPQQYPISHTLRDGGYAGSFSSGNSHYGWDTTTTGTVITPTATSASLPFAKMHCSQLAGNLVDSQYLGKGTTSGINEYYDGFNPAVPYGLNGAFQTSGAPGDWDNMTGSIEDGPYINKPDEGNSDTVSNLANTAGDFKNASGTYTISGGYFSRGLDRYGTGSSGGGGDYRNESGITFSPNRQVCSAVMFGSLPAGINPAGGSATQNPWQTLLFCPNPAAGSSHPGFGSPASGPPFTTPPDHLLLDLFTMPVVEPYAISEPLSTAGKINMNYQILPFTYITRDTGVRAVLKSTRIMAIPTNASTRSSAASRAYKDGSPYPYECRYDINPDESTGTLKGFENRFANGDIFRSASEICSIYLVPKTISNATYPTGVSAPAAYADTATWWTTGAGGTGFRLTGDNTREFPYGDIYARLTTKSNTYTVHIRAQSLKKVANTSATRWVEGQDLVVGEYRGSTTLERYIDTGDTSLPDFAKSSSPSAEAYYKIHIINTRKFEP